MRPYIGRKFTIELTDDARDTWPQVEATADNACLQQLRRLAERFADLGRLQSPNQIRDEGEGIWAIKARCGLRAYGYYDPHRRSIFVISHFIHKKKNKMDPADHQRAKDNRNGRR